MQERHLHLQLGSGTVGVIDEKVARSDCRSSSPPPDNYANPLRLTPRQWRRKFGRDNSGGRSPAKPNGKATVTTVGLRLRRGFRQVSLPRRPLSADCNRPGAPGAMFNALDGGAAPPWPPWLYDTVGRPLSACCSCTRGGHVPGAFSEL